MPRISITILTCLVALSLSAAPSWSAQLPAAEWAGCGGGYNGGQWDDAGRMYVACGSPTSIHIFNAAGVQIERIPTGRFVSDVAPTADGSTVYAATGGAIVRYLRVSAGFQLDAGFSLQTYPMDGSSFTPTGYSISVDAHGYLYVADGAWAPNQTNTVVKYDSAGRFMTRFGGWQNSWNPGIFYWSLAGVTANRDGSEVLTVEIGNNRVQRWVRQSNGSYVANGGWGATQANNADREGDCQFGGWLGKFAAPYDVAYDKAGLVYVMNTTCKQVLIFTAAGQYLDDADVSINGGDYPRPHGFAVAADGTVLVGESSRIVRRTGSGQYALRFDGAALVPNPPAALPIGAQPAPLPRTTGRARSRCRNGFVLKKSRAGKLQCTRPRCPSGKARRRANGPCLNKSLLKRMSVQRKRVALRR